jgi:hypothetical protein
MRDAGDATLPQPRYATQPPLTRYAHDMRYGAPHVDGAVCRLMLPMRMLRSASLRYAALQMLVLRAMLRHDARQRAAT